MCMKRQMKHWEQKLVTSVYNHCNICNIPIYFCNIHMRHLQHIYETSETLETYFYNMHFLPLLLDDAEQSGEWPVPASRRSRMVARPGNGQLCLCLAWTQQTRIPSLGHMSTHGHRCLQVEVEDAVEMEDAGGGR
jgi:hypothetical protein